MEETHECGYVTVAGYINCDGKIRTDNIKYTRRYPYVNDDGIYMPCSEYEPESCDTTYRMLMSKEMFVEAYNKWIKGVDCDDGK